MCVCAYLNKTFFVLSWTVIFKILLVVGKNQISDLVLVSKEAICFLKEEIVFT